MSADKSLNALSALVFDFDGTLVDSFPMFLAVFSSVVKPDEEKANFVIRHESIRKLMREMLVTEFEKGNERLRPKILLLKVFYNTCRKMGLNRYSALFKTLYSAYKVKKQYQEIELFSGAKELLESLHEQGIPLILVTHSSRKSVLKILERYSLQNIFSIILDRGDLGSNKSQGIVDSLHALGINPAQAIAIGDLPADILEAKAAGVKTVGVTTGPVNRDRLEAVQPDVLIESIDQLKAVLEGDDSTL